MDLNEADVTRFWSKVRITPGCWEWQGGRDEDGYGQFSIKGVPRRAHRASWVISSGKIPDGLWVLHRCDNPPCVNPDHLFLGTHLDNRLDCKAKKRTRGGGPHRCKLTASDVIDIRTIRAMGAKHQDIADAFGVSSQQISHICARKSWSHV